MRDISHLANLMCLQLRNCVKEESAEGTDHFENFVIFGNVDSF